MSSPPWAREHYSGLSAPKIGPTAANSSQERRVRCVISDRSKVRAPPLPSKKNREKMWVAKIFEIIVDLKGREREICTQVIPMPENIKTEAHAVEWADMYIETGEDQFLEVTELKCPALDEDIPRL